MENCKGITVGLPYFGPLCRAGVSSSRVVPTLISCSEPGWRAATVAGCRMINEVQVVKPLLRQRMTFRCRGRGHVVSYDVGQ